MKIYFDDFQRPEPAKVYLGTPSNKILCALNGIDENTFNLKRNLNNAYEISFDIYRYIEKDGIEIESNGYEWINLFMRIYVDSVGWFICSPPAVFNDGIKEYKSITASSCEIEMVQHDITNLKINCGTTDSYEMLVKGNVELIDEVEFAKEQIKFYNKNNPDLSLLDILLKVSGLYGWTIGHIDNIPKQYKYYENGMLKTKYTYLCDEVGVFNIDTQDLYSFITQNMAQYFGCIFVFDINKLTINAYRPENLGEDTNINISFRNLQNSNEIIVDENNIFTVYTVSGADDLGITYVNGGTNVIENIDYFLNEKYLSKDVITKYKFWKQSLKYYRPLYTEYTKLYNEQLSVISELKDRLPLDDCSTDWSTFEDGKLVEAKANYEAQLKGYEEYYVNIDGDFDEEALKKSVDAKDYYQIKNVVLPSIEIEINNRKLGLEDPEEYIKSYETNWDLYGLDELQVKLDTYNNTISVAKSGGYDVAYSEGCGHTQDYHEAMYEKYQEAKKQTNGNVQGSCQYAYNERNAEINAATKILEEYNTIRKDAATMMDKNTWVYDASLSDAEFNDNGVLIFHDAPILTDNGVLISDSSLSSSGVLINKHLFNDSLKENKVENNILIFPSIPTVNDNGVLLLDGYKTNGNGILATENHMFSEKDLSELSKLYVDNTYSNENMFLVSSDTAVTAIDEQLKLLDAAEDDLYAASQPQFTYTTNLDNFLARYDYRDYTNSLDLGDFVWLGVRDDYVVKLRVISMSYNPMVMDNNLEIEFSNMIRSRAKRDDFTYLLGNTTGRGKSASSGNGGDYTSNEGIGLTPGLISKLVANGSFKNTMNQWIEEGMAIQGGNIIAGSADGLSVDKLNAKLIEVTDIKGENAFFEYLQSKLISTDKIVADSGIFDELSALVANIDKLTAGEITAEDIAAGNFHSLKLAAGAVEIDTAIVSDLFAGRLGAGIIDTNQLNLQSEDGGLSIVGNTMQFKDKEGNIRIQIGRDSEGDFTFTLYDVDGQGVLIDHTGIQPSAISDGLIVDEMVASNTLTTEKLAFEINTNEDGQVIYTNMVDNQGNSLGSVITKYDDNISQISKVVDLETGTIKNEVWQTSFDLVDEDGNKLIGNDGNAVSGSILQHLTNHEISIGGISSTVEEIESAYDDVEGTTLKKKISSVVQTVNSIESMVINEDGSSKIEQEANRIEASVNNKIDAISGSVRNLIRNSKTMFYNKYSLLSGGTAHVDNKGVLNVNTAQGIDINGVMIFNVHTPTIDNEGILNF